MQHLASSENDKKRLEIRGVEKQKLGKGFKKKVNFFQSKFDMGVRVIYALGPHILKSFKEFSVSFELLQ